MGGSEKGQTGELSASTNAVCFTLEFSQHRRHRRHSRPKCGGEFYGPAIPYLQVTSQPHCNLFANAFPGMEANSSRISAVLHTEAPMHFGAAIKLTSSNLQPYSESTIPYTKMHLHVPMGLTTH